MFHMNQNLEVVLATEPVDLRKSFNGLYVIARNELGEIPAKIVQHSFCDFKCCISQSSISNRPYRLIPSPHLFPLKSH